MEMKKNFSEMFNYQKNFIDNAFDLMAKIQTQGEQMMKMSIDNNPWLPEESKRICSYWSETRQNFMQNYKECIDANFNKMTDIASESKKTAKA